MDAVFIDVNGNKKNFLYQYDVGQTLIVEDFKYEKAPKIQFSIKSLETSLSEQSTLDSNTLKVDIPDVLLTHGEDIVAYIYIEDEEQRYVSETIFISVCPRKRPSNYICPSAIQTLLDNKADKADLIALQEQIGNVAVATELIMTDISTGVKYTLGVNNGELIAIPFNSDTLYYDVSNFDAETDVYASDAFRPLIKVSDIILTEEDFVNGAVYTATYDNGEYTNYEYNCSFNSTNYETNIEIGTDGIIYLANCNVICVPSDDFADQYSGATFPEKGIYFSGRDSKFPDSNYIGGQRTLTIPGYGKFKASPAVDTTT